MRRVPERLPEKLQQLSIVDATVYFFEFERFVSALRIKTG